MHPNGGNQQKEWVFELTDIFIVGPVERHYHFFVDGVYFIPAFENHGRLAQAMVEPWTGKNKLVQRAYNINSVQQAANILRKCILYPEPTKCP